MRDISSGRRRFILAIAASAMGAICLLGLSDEAEAGPKAYEFWCRGGGSMLVEQFAEQSYEPRIAWVRFTYAKNSQGAMQNGAFNASRLAPGKCSWSDRGINDDEPARLLSFPTRDPAELAQLDSMVECGRDPHCVFRVWAYRDGTSFKMENRGSVAFRYAP